MPLLFRLPAFAASPWARPLMPPAALHTTSRRANTPWTAMAARPAARTDLAAAPFRLAPSDFAFLWDECQRCFYLKAHKLLYRPRAPFPSIFGTIDAGMKRHFRGLSTSVLIPEMKPGTFLCEENDAWVECQPITPPGHSASVYIRGMVDCLVRFDDGTYGVIDFKTSQAAKSSATYARQLHAYAQAVENPSRRSELERGTVSDMGLVVYTPSEFHTPTTAAGEIAAALTGDLTYVNVPRDDDGFMSFLGDVLDVLTLPQAPPPPPPAKGRWGGAHSSCPYCQFLHDAAEKGYIHGHG